MHVCGIYKCTEQKHQCGWLNAIFTVFVAKYGQEPKYHPHTIVQAPEASGHPLTDKQLLDLRYWPELSIVTAMENSRLDFQQLARSTNIDKDALQALFSDEKGLLSYALHHEGYPGFVRLMNGTIEEEKAKKNFEKNYFPDGKEKQQEYLKEHGPTYAAAYAHWLKSGLTGIYNEHVERIENRHFNAKMEKIIQKISEK